MALYNDIKIKVNSTLTKTVGLSNVTATLVKNISEQLSWANQLYVSTTDFPGGGVLTLTLDDDSLKDPNGDAITLLRVYFLLIINNSDQPITIGGGLEDIEIGQIEIPAYGVLPLLATYNVSIGNNTLTISGVNGEEVQIVIIGN
jgi:hypothetical protein